MEGGVVVSSSIDNEAITAALAMLGVYWVILIAILVLQIVAYWKIYTKAGKPGWASLIPIYNVVVLFQTANMSALWVLAMLVPILNIVAMILLYVNLAKAFGKSGGFAVGLIFLNIIFMAILAFGSAEYEGA